MTTAGAQDMRMVGLASAVCLRPSPSWKSDGTNVSVAGVNQSLVGGGAVWGRRKFGFSHERHGYQRSDARPSL